MSLRLNLLLNLLLLAPLLPGQRDETAPPKVTIRLSGQALVPGHEVLLSDIARITTKDQALAQTLGSLAVGPTPKGAWSRRIYRNEIRRILEQRGIAKTELRMEGQDRVEVMAAIERLSPDDVIKTAETVLRAMLVDEGETDAEWSLAQRPRFVSIPVARKSRRLSAVAPAGRLNRSSSLLHVKVEVDGQVVRTLPLTFRIQRFKEILVTSRTLKAGEAIDAKSVVHRRVDVAGLVLEPLTDPTQIGGRVAARALRNGAPITANDLRLPAIVFKNEPITVVVQVGRVRIARQGIARADGGRGEIIPITVDPKRPSVFARVYAPGLAVISATERKVVPASFPPRRRS